MKIAVLSDTHGLLRPEVKEMISRCEAVIHAGDINSRKLLDEIKAVKKADAEFYVVRGNADKEWAESLPVYEKFSLRGVRFFLVHNKKDIPDDPGDCQIVVYGHSHRYACESRDGRLWLNPGSCGRRRFRQDITMAVLDLEGPDASGWKVERIDIPHEKAGNLHPESAGKDPGLRKKMTEKDVLQTVEMILRRMEKGQTVTEAAKELDVDPEFVEDVYRMKVTHPGVTAREILNKIEIKGTGR